MMRHTSKGLVLAGVVACAGAARHKVDMESASAVQVVDHIASLLGRENGELRRIAEAAQATPGVGGQFTASLQKVAGSIEGTLQPRVQEAHDSTQRLIDTTFKNVQSATGLAVEHKATADQKDQAWFSCVAEELEKKTFHETSQDKLEIAQGAEEEACALQQKHKGFAFAAGDKYNFDFKCDHSIENSCQEKLKAFQKHTGEMQSDAEELYQAKKKYYEDLEADCKTKVAETKTAGQELAAAGNAHESHRDKCETVQQERVKHICEYGDAVQAKGTDEAEFKKLMAAVEGRGTEESEADRQQEWTSLVTSGCMIKRSIALGMKGPVSETDMKACSAQAQNSPLEKLNTQADAFKTLTESHPCVFGRISFSNGEQWKVSGNGENSEDYSKEKFTPELHPTDGEQPFKMCPQENEEKWRKVVTDHKAAAKAEKYR